MGENATNRTYNMNGTVLMKYEHKVQPLVQIMQKIAVLLRDSVRNRSLFSFHIEKRLDYYPEIFST